MKLIGFLSRNNYFPAPLISVVSDGKIFYAVFPSGDWVKLIDVGSVEALKARPSFVRSVGASARTSVPRLAFGVSRDTVFTGTAQHVSSSLRDYLSRTDTLDSTDREAIFEFLQALNGLLGALSANELVKTLSGASPIVAKVMPRQLKNQRGRAETLIVQRRQKGQTKTLYRKGIPFGKSLSDVRISPNVANFLHQAAAA
jgi:hypothetical protein